MQNVSVASEFRLTVGLKRKSVVSGKFINATQLRRQKCLKRPPMSGCPGLTRTTLYESCKSLWVAFWQYRTQKATRKYEATSFTTSFTTWPVPRFDTYLETGRHDAPAWAEMRLLNVEKMPWCGTTAYSAEQGMYASFLHSKWTENRFSVPTVSPLRKLSIQVRHVQIIWRTSDWWLWTEACNNKCRLSDSLAGFGHLQH